MTWYKTLVRPILFKFDSEKVHNLITITGENLENSPFLLEPFFTHKNSTLNKEVLGIKFENPIGLSAGFDYDGHLAKTMKHVGFGFNTVGTVTAKPYIGNPPPRLGRLINSRSLLVNKGFKSSGAKAIASRLDQKNLTDHTIGISVGSSNIPQINTIKKAIADYLITFNIFKNKKYVSYFELNISCPNTTMTESFTNAKNFENLIKKITKLHIKQPIFVKMPNEISFTDSDMLVSTGLKYGIKGYIFSNLVKDRKNKYLIKRELEKFKNNKGNFSGRPTFENSNKLIVHTKRKFGKRVIIIGCGGVFNAKDAIKKMDCGADLIQLATGLIFEGPSIAKSINKRLIAK